MYFDKKVRRWPYVIFAAVMLAVAAGFYIGVVRPSGQSLHEEGAQALKAAVERSARQCYVVEGVYPPDVSYLENSYGLTVNHEDFYVTYNAFASNLPPDVRVTERN